MWRWVISDRRGYLATYLRHTDSSVDQTRSFVCSLLPNFINSDIITVTLHSLLSLTVFPLTALATPLECLLDFSQLFHHVDTSHYQRPVVFLPNREHACDLPHPVHTPR